MTRRIVWSFVGLLVLSSLAGCGRGFFQTAEREAWRGEAEAACLKSGSVREGTGLVRIEPISGPGVCGAEYPLKVAALGGVGGSFGFADDLRPPGGIPLSRQPRWPLQQNSSYTAQSSGPVSLRAPGSADDDQAELYENSPRLGQPGAAYPRESSREQPYRVAPQPTPPQLGPTPAAPMTSSIGPVTIKPAATLACPLVSQLDRWIAETVQPSALRWFGLPVAEIKQISAYSCRGMNGNPNAHISEHAFGNALDIAAFTLADGRRISVKDGWKGLPEEQGFLRDVQGGACQQFNTVLAPGSNVYHYDHIHVDLMRRSSGRVICKPPAVSGDQVASRASSRGGYAGRDTTYTGSIAQAGRKFFSRSKSRGSDDDWIEDESHIREK